MSESYTIPREEGDLSEVGAKWYLMHVQASGMPPNPWSYAYSLNAHHVSIGWGRFIAIFLLAISSNELLFFLGTMTRVTFSFFLKF